MHNWEKLQELTWEERKILLQALLLLPVVHLLLQCLGYFRLARWVQERISVKTTHKSLTVAEKYIKAAEAAHMVSIAANHGLFRATCLRRSLALIVLLRRRGIECQLCLGARLNDHGLEAHAWVEVQGVVINDRADIRQQYTPLETGFPATQAGL